MSSGTRSSTLQRVTVPSIHIPGRGTPGRGTPGRGTPGRGTPGRGTPGRRTTPGRGTQRRGTTPGRGTQKMADAEFKAWSKKHYCSGEIYDSTSTSGNNPYGESKIVYSIMYGISLPIQKILEELYKILSGPIDDKSKKRFDRYIFLYYCNLSPPISIYFRKMYNYLNGGNGISATQFWQDLNFICAGGNILTIFAKLLQNLVNYKNIGTPLEGLNKTGMNLLSSNDYDAILLYINSATAAQINQKDIPNSQYDQNIPTFSAILLELSNSGFSDFDYNFVPFFSENLIRNDFIDPTTSDPMVTGTHTNALYGSIRAKLNTMIPDLDSQRSGFVLYREKTRFFASTDAYLNLKQTSMEDKLARSECASININHNPLINIKDLYAQMVNDNIFRQIPINKPLCKRYYDFLLKKKTLISSATKNNVTETIKYWANKDPANIMTDLDSIINYIHTVTSKLNTQLKQKQITNVFQTFQTLDSISNSTELLGAMGTTLYNFITQPEFHTTPIINQILANSAVCGDILQNNLPTYIYASNTNNRAIKNTYFTPNVANLQLNTLIGLNTIETNELDDPDNEDICPRSGCEIVKQTLNQVLPSNDSIVNFIVGYYNLRHYNISTNVGKDPEIIELIKTEYNTDGINLRNMRSKDVVIRKILRTKTNPTNNNNSKNSQLAYQFVTNSIGKNESQGGKKTLKYKKNRSRTNKKKSRKK